MEARQQVQDLGGDLVVGFNADVRIVRGWFESSGMPPDLTVLADPQARLYEALGTRRTDPLRLVASQALPALKSLRRGLMPSATRADMLRLGADAAIRADGEVALLHIATSADDRVPIEDLIAALRTAQPPSSGAA